MRDLSNRFRKVIQDKKRLGPQRVAERFLAELAASDDVSHLKLNREDLDGFVMALGMIECELTGKPLEAPAEAGARVWEAITRMANAEKRSAPSIGKKFADAYEHREQGRRAGLTISAKQLSQKFDAFAFNKNPDSAVRSMQRGLGRIEQRQAKPANQ